MTSFSPSGPFTVPMTILTPTWAKVNGVRVKTFAEGRTLFCSFRTFGGTEREQDGLTAVEDTATVQTWYAPDLTAGMRLRMEDGSEWEVLGTPEDIAMRRQWAQMKVRRVQGGA